MTLEEKLLHKTQAVYKALVSEENQYETLTKEEIHEILSDELKPYYSYILSSLANIGKVIKKSGRTGGIELARRRGMTLELKIDNINKIKSYFKSLNLSAVADANKTTAKKCAKLEDELYEPLKKYLVSKGMFDIIENRGSKRKGQKWENADLICFKYNKLNFHFGIQPKLTAIEVKREFPAITHIQQTASYLRYCNAAYLCFHDTQYTGKDFDTLFTKLQDEGIWELTTVFRIGLIVSYTPQINSPNIKFHLLKEAPDIAQDQSTVEEGIKLLLSKDAQIEIMTNLREQLNTIIFPE